MNVFLYWIESIDTFFNLLLIAICSVLGQLEILGRQLRKEWTEKRFYLSMNSVMDILMLHILVIGFTSDAYYGDGIFLTMTYFLLLFFPHNYLCIQIFFFNGETVQSGFVVSTSPSARSQLDTPTVSSRSFLIKFFKNPLTVTIHIYLTAYNR